MVRWKRMPKMKGAIQGDQEAEQGQRQAPDDREHREQVALFEWVEYQLTRYPELELLFAIPNDGDRHPVVGARLRAEGVRRGVPATPPAVTAGSNQDHTGVGLFMCYVEVIVSGGS